MYGFFPLGYIPWKGVAGLYRKFMYNFLRHCRAIFQSGYTILRSRQQSVRALTFPYTRQDLLLSVF